MPFVELTPLKSSDLGTGVKISNGAHGLSVSLIGKALVHLGEASTLRVLLDVDRAYPRLRIVRDPKGPFKMKRSALSKTGHHFLRFGQRPGIKGEIKGAMCTWETIDIQYGVGIDIDLPRELFPTATTTVHPVNTRAAHSGSPPRGKPVTLARVNGID